MSVIGYVEIEATKLIAACDALIAEHNALVKEAREEMIAKIMGRKWFAPKTRATAIKMLTQSMDSPYYDVGTVGVHWVNCAKMLSKVAKRSSAPNVLVSAQVAHALYNYLYK